MFLHKPQTCQISSCLWQESAVFSGFGSVFSLLSLYFTKVVLKIIWFKQNGITDIYFENTDHVFANDGLYDAELYVSFIFIDRRFVNVDVSSTLPLRPPSVPVFCSSERICRRRARCADVSEITPFSLLLFKLIIRVKLFPPTRTLINTHVQTTSGHTNWLQLQSVCMCVAAGLQAWGDDGKRSIFITMGRFSTLKQDWGERPKPEVLSTNARNTERCAPAWPNTHPRAHVHTHAVQIGD